MIDAKKIKIFNMLYGTCEECQQPNCNIIPMYFCWLKRLDDSIVVKRVLDRLKAVTTQESTKGGDMETNNEARVEEPQPQTTYYGPEGERQGLEWENHFKKLAAKVSKK